MKKTKLITMAVSFLLTVGMVGAGFASWLITSEVQEEKTGTIKVESVIDSRLDLTVGDADGVHFGVPTAMNDDDPWLTASADAASEDLSSTVSLTVNNASTLYNSDNTSGYRYVVVTATLIISKASLVNVYNPDPNAAINYIVLPGVDTQADSNNYQIEQKIVIDLNAAEAGDVVFTFRWGSDFGNVNPYDFFNGKSSSATCEYYEFNTQSKTTTTTAKVEKTYADFAYSALSALADLNGSTGAGLGFTIKIVAKPSTTNPLAQNS